MSTLAIHLLGTPRVELAGSPLPAPRGHKAWGLLAYLICTARPPTRGEVVSLLFADADDPLGALRWNLTALRRALPGTVLEGDPLRLELPEGTWVDVAAVTGGSPAQAVRVAGLERELLAGLSFASSPAFDIWLLGQRRHLAAAAEGALHEAALAKLSRGDTREAAGLAQRLLAMNPLDENFHVLLVRALAAGGDGIGAARQVARCREILRAELGVEPSPALAAAADTVTSAPTAGPVSGRAAARAQVEAGEAALAAGAIEAGLQCLRRAVVDARAARDPALEAEALLALGAALVHAARGRDEEASAALHEAVAVALRADRTLLAAAAARELGYVEFLQARYERAEAWLERAADLAGGDARERGRVGSVLGSVLSDTAHYERAMQELLEAERLGREAGDGRQVAYTLAMLGRAHLLRGEHDAAAERLDGSLAAADAERWTAFTPWPASFRAEVDLARGDVDGAADRFEHAFALGCQIGDPCWEGAAARGAGLVAAARGRHDDAVGWLEDARRRCARLPDAYVWVEAYVLDALCSVGVAQGLQEAPAWTEELAALAARGGMRELEARAYAHRGRLGDEAAATAAALLAAEIDNPALQGSRAAPGAVAG